jgi:hypothetical protein
MGEISFIDRLKHSWNAFKDTAVLNPYYNNYGISYATRPDRVRLTIGNEKSIVSSVYNRIGIDVASVKIQHVRLDENDRFVEVIKSGLNDCLTVEANIDQSGRAFIQDAVMSMFDEGVVALVPTASRTKPTDSNFYDVTSLRTAKILEWYPKHIRILIYNDETGQKEELTIPKRLAAIVENPLYSVMNEPNSTLKRLINKLNILDAIDAQSGSGKLDLIIQLPYVIKTEAKKEQAEKRRKDIEEQLTGSKYGVAYTDGTERVIQLNRPAENNLMGQIEYLTRMLYSQLGITEGVFDGTADEKAMLNYYNRTIEPVLAALTENMRRTFLTKTARSQGQSITYFKNQFTLVETSKIADIADKFTRNEILTSNEMRSIIGFKPSNDPRADKLVNKNLNQPEEEVKVQEENKEGDTNAEGL